MVKSRKISATDDKLIKFKIETLTFKKFLPILLLGIIIVLGIFLRAYHLNYPVIGYHNWKTVHYITEARNFANDGFFKHGFFVPMRDTMGGINEPEDGAHGDTFPFTPILLAVLFKIFGESLVMVRIVNIIFSIGYILFSYLLVKKLFNMEDLALLTAFLTSINPLFVFFSHNVQMDTQALLFMMAGLYYYVVWYKENNGSFGKLYFSIFLLSFAAATKYSFAAAFIPVAFSFPYMKYASIKEIKKAIAPALICLLLFSIFPIWFYYSQFIINKNVYEVNFPQTASKVSGFEGIKRSVDFSLVTDSNFWATMKSYVADNYSIIGFNFAILGSLLFIYLFLTKHKKDFSYKFAFGYIASSLLFLFIMGKKLSGHNYHQFPVAPFIIFFIAYFFIVISRNIGSFFKEGFLNAIVIVSVILILLFVFPGTSKSVYAQQMAGMERMFNTQFPGLDLAGYYVRDHSLPTERIYHSSHQSYGILWHAERKGYKVPSTPELFKRGEDEFGVEWAFAYQWGISTFFNSGEMFEYMKKNYRLVQFAYVQQGQQAQPLYFLFRKGGSFNESQLNTLLSNKPVKKTTYHYTSGPYDIYSIDLE